MRFQKSVFLAVIFVMAACGSHEGLTTLSWNKDHPNRQLWTLRGLDFTSPGVQDTKFESVEIGTQSLHGIPIDASFVKRILDHDGQLLQVDGNIEAHPRFSYSKVMAFQKNKDQVLKVLQDRLPELRSSVFDEPAMVLVKEGKLLNLYWAVQYLDSAGLPWRILIDANDNIHSRERFGSDFQDMREMAVKIFPEGPRHSVLQSVLLKDVLTNGGLSSERVNVSSLADVKIAPTSDLNFMPPDKRFDEVQVFYFVNRALDWFQDHLGVTLHQTLDVQVHMGAPEKTNTAFYYQDRIRLGSGDDQTYSNIPEDPTIVMHETAHSVIDQLAHLPFQGEGGSINEGLADFFTAVQLDDPNMGDSAYLKAAYRRTLENNDTLAMKDGGLYHDSGIVSGTLWEMKKKLGPAMAADIALKLLIQLNPNSDFADVQKKWPGVLATLLKGSDLQTAQQILKTRGWL